MNERLRKLVFRANHRGLKELDVILGRFAESHLAELSLEELDQFDHLLQAPDTDVLNWLMGADEVPAEHNHALLTRLRQFNLVPADYTKTE